METLNIAIEFVRASAEASAESALPIANIPATSDFSFALILLIAAIAVVGLFIIGARSNKFFGINGKHCESLTFSHAKITCVALFILLLAGACIFSVKAFANEGVFTTTDKIYVYIDENTGEVQTSAANIKCNKDVIAKSSALTCASDNEIANSLNFTFNLSDNNSERIVYSGISDGSSYLLSAEQGTFDADKNYLLNAEIDNLSTDKFLAIPEGTTYNLAFNYFEPEYNIIPINTTYDGQDHYASVSCNQAGALFSYGQTETYTNTITLDQADKAYDLDALPMCHCDDENTIYYSIQYPNGKVNKGSFENEITQKPLSVVFKEPIPQSFPISSPKIEPKFDLNNLVSGDTCDLSFTYIKDGKTFDVPTEAGSYKAKITSLSNDDYCLSTDSAIEVDLVVIPFSLQAYIDEDNTLQFHYTTEDMSTYAKSAEYYWNEDNFNFTKTDMGESDWPYNGCRSWIHGINIDEDVKEFKKFISTSNMFASIKSAESLYGVENLYLSNVTNTSKMFYELAYNSTNYNSAPDFSNSDFSKVTNTSSMFENYAYKSSTINCFPKFDNCNWSSIKNASNMFAYYAYNTCASLTLNFDMIALNFVNFENISNLFYNFAAGGNLSGLDFKVNCSGAVFNNATNASSCFQSIAYTVKEISGNYKFDYNFSNCKFKKDVYLYGMFKSTCFHAGDINSNSSSINSLNFKANLSNLDFEQNADVDSLFMDCCFNANIKDVNFDVDMSGTKFSKLASLNCAFFQCFYTCDKCLNEINFKTNMSNIKLKDVSYSDTKWAHMYYDAFQTANKVNFDINWSGFDCNPDDTEEFSSKLDLCNMFDGMGSHWFSQFNGKMNLSNMDINADDSFAMFQDFCCAEKTQNTLESSKILNMDIDMSNSTIRAKNITQFFYRFGENCSSIKNKVNLKNTKFYGPSAYWFMSRFSKNCLDAPGVDFTGMYVETQNYYDCFSDFCLSSKTIDYFPDISSWNFQNASSLENMFYGYGASSTKLPILDLSKTSFPTSLSPSYEGIFGKVPMHGIKLPASWTTNLFDACLIYKDPFAEGDVDLVWTNVNTMETYTGEEGVKTMPVGEDVEYSTTYSTDE